MTKKTPHYTADFKAEAIKKYPRFCSSVRTPSQKLVPSFFDSHIPSSFFLPSRLTPRAKSIALLMICLS